MQDIALWKRIAEHPLDAPGSTAPFSVKLATAEGWSKAYTNQVIAEYRRFVYLTQISDAQVTPSRAVDRAWHMHLTFTRDYWDVFCPNVLGKPLHHDPCAGEEEMPRYRAQFEQTKALYLREFGGPAPANVWGKAANWTGVLCGASIGLIGLVLFFMALGGTGSLLSFPVILAAGLILGGFGFAVHHSPDFAAVRAAPPKKSGFGCGRCGGGCGGCGG